MKIITLIILILPIITLANPRQFEKVKGVAGYHKKFTGYYGPFYIMDQHTKAISNKMLKKMGMKQLNGSAHFNASQVDYSSQQVLKKPTQKPRISFSKMAENISNQDRAISEENNTVFSLQDSLQQVSTF